MTNNFIERKVGEYQKEFANGYSPLRGQEFLRTALTEMVEETTRKFLNQPANAHDQAVREQVLSEVEKCVPKEREMGDFTTVDIHSTGFNLCREEFLSNLSNLKTKK